MNLFPYFIILANSADPDKEPPYATFHPGHYCCEGICLKGKSNL